MGQATSTCLIGSCGIHSARRRCSPSGEPFHDLAGGPFASSWLPSAAGAVPVDRSFPRSAGAGAPSGQGEPLWSYQRIRGELLQLGHPGSATSIRNLLRRHPIPPAPPRARLTWRRFLQAHGRAILACDYFTVDTVFLKRPYILFFLELASRRILFTACSAQHPGGAWAAQQARNLAWELQEAEVRRHRRRPGSCRRDRGSGNLEAVLAEYVEHNNGHRPHRSLELRPSRGPTVLPAVTGRQGVRRTRVHGLINECSRQAA